MSLLAAFLAVALQPAPGDFVRDENTDLLDFSYSWPARAERDRLLRVLLRERMEAARARATADARESRRLARQGGYEFRQHSYGQGWAVAGQPVQLLSLTASISTYGGGAHGNMAFDSLLWDDLPGRAIDIVAFLGPGLVQMEPRYCAELDRMRAERRREARIESDAGDPFSACPPIAAQVLAFADTDNNPHFDTLLVLLPPYAAGPYVEGEYVVAVQLDDGDLAHVPEPQRGAFFPWGERIIPLPSAPEE